VSKYFFEEITGIRSQVPAIFTIKGEGVLEDSIQLIYFFDLVLRMGANGASRQEPQIAPKNRFHGLAYDLSNSVQR
jgi:hypothetical protein